MTCSIRYGFKFQSQQLVGLRITICQYPKQCLFRRQLPQVPYNGPMGPKKIFSKNLLYEYKSFTFYAIFSFLHEKSSFFGFQCSLLGSSKNSCFSIITHKFVDEMIKVHKIGLICIHKANFLRIFFCPMGPLQGTQGSYLLNKHCFGYIW